MRPREPRNAQAFILGGNEEERGSSPPAAERKTRAGARIQKHPGRTQRSYPTSKGLLAPPGKNRTPRHNLPTTSHPLWHWCILRCAPDNLLQPYALRFPALRGQAPDCFLHLPPSLTIPASSTSSILPVSSTFGYRTAAHAANQGVSPTRQQPTDTNDVAPPSMTRAGAVRRAGPFTLQAPLSTSGIPRAFRASPGSRVRFQNGRLHTFRKPSCKDPSCCSKTST